MNERTDLVDKLAESTSGVVATAIGGALSGAILGWFLIFTDPLNRFSYELLGAAGSSYGRLGPTALVLPWIEMGLLIVAGVGAALTCLSVSARTSPRLPLMGTGLATAGGVAGLALAVGYGRATGYSNDSATILIEIGLVPVGCAVAIALGRRRLSSPARSRP